MVKHRQTVPPLKTAQKHFRPTHVFVAQIKTHHAGPLDPASQAQASHRSQSASLRHQALGPDQQSYVFLRNQAYTLFDHHWSRTKAVTATLATWSKGFCEYIVALNLEGSRPRNETTTRQRGVERHEQLHYLQEVALVASARATTRALVSWNPPCSFVRVGHMRT